MSEANNTNTKKNGKGLWILGISILAVLIGLFVILFALFGPKTAEGSKNVTLSVVSENGDSTAYETKTDALVLQELMDEKTRLEEALAEKMERWVYLNDLNDRIQAQGK